jgi:GNAT superfamily N-acetyltransferase
VALEAAAPACTWKANGAYRCDGRTAATQRCSKPGKPADRGGLLLPRYGGRPRGHGGDDEEARQKGGHAGASAGAAAAAPPPTPLTAAIVRDALGAAYEVVRLADAEPAVRSDAVRHLYEQWRAEFAAAGVQFPLALEARLLDSPSNALHVFVPRAGGLAWAGIVGIDDASPVVGATLSAPCINHLYARPELRGRGLGRAMLAWAEGRIAARGFAVASLWCYLEMEPYYRPLGWARVALGRAAAASSAAATAAPRPRQVSVMGKALGAGATALLPQGGGVWLGDEALVASAPAPAPSDGLTATADLVSVRIL